MATVWEDTLQQAGKHEIKHDWFAKHGVELVQTRFDGKHGVPVSFGDYYREGSNVVVDTKRDVDEIAHNISGKNHDRFKRECLRARDEGYRLVILIENRNGYKRLVDVCKWVNTHCMMCKTRSRAACDPGSATGKCARHNTRKPIQGARLYKAMSTMSERYGVEFEFCHPRDSARRICELLGVRYDDEQNAGSSAETTRSGVQDTPNQARD